MKTLFTLILAVCLQSLVLGQGSDTYCLLTYTEGKWAVAHSDTLKHKCSELRLAGLPDLSQASTPMNLHITSMGAYSFKKEEGLVIPDDYTVVMEDLLTGQYYNLRSPAPYSFTMNRGFGQTRFLLEIIKNPVKQATASK